MIRRFYGKPASPGRWFWPLFVVLALAACNRPPELAETVTTTTTPRFLSYWTPTPSTTIVQTIAAPAATLTPLPSPTPFMYTIEEGDTLLTIAFRFGVTVDEIMAVNPGVNPRLLSIGTSLVIPLGEAGEVVIPTATPIPLLVGATTCYSTPDRALWCFFPVLNELAIGVEGVTGEIAIYTPEGEIHASELALPPLDVIPAGSVLPLYASFSGPVPAGFMVRGRLSGAFLADGGGDRRLAIDLVEASTTLDGSGLSVRVRGVVEISAEGEGETLVEGVIRVAAVGYDSRGQVAGLRVWEQAVSAEPGDRFPFEFLVNSLGPPIFEVDVLAEGLAVSPPLD